MAEYRTISQAAQDEFVEKRSRFIGYARPVQTEEEAAAFIAEMRSKCRKFKLEMDVKMIIIDYLQLLQMPDGAWGWTDKQIVDYNLQRFFSLAESSDVPVLLISSFNRAAYNSEASLASFKDSGSIEYSCDVVIAMDLYGAGGEGFDELAGRVRTPRDILVRILKHKYGKAGDELPFLYDARYSFFKDPSAEEEDENVLYFP